MCIVVTGHLPEYTTTSAIQFDIVKLGTRDLVESRAIMKSKDYWNRYLCTGLHVTLITSKF